MNQGVPFHSCGHRQRPPPHRGDGLRTLAACALVVGLTLTGCLRNKVVVHVNADGSGHILVTRLYSREMAAMVEAQRQEFQKQMDTSGQGAGLRMPEDPFYNEKALAWEARQYGAGVTFVKAKKVEQDGARGAIAQYDFADINDVFLNLDMKGLAMAQGMAMAPMPNEDVSRFMPPAEKTTAVEFQFATGAVSRLTVLMPSLPTATVAATATTPADATQRVAAAAGSTNASDTAADANDELSQPAFGHGEEKMMMGGGNPFGFTGRETVSEVMRKMYKGLRWELQVEVDGPVTRSELSHKDAAKASRFVLLDLNFDTLTQSSDLARAMAQMESARDPDDSLRELLTLPGVIRETRSKAAVEFQTEPKETTKAR